MRSKVLFSVVAALAALCVSFGGSAKASCLATPVNFNAPVLSVIAQSTDGPILQVTSGDWQACSELSFEYVISDGDGNVIADDVDAGDSDTVATLNNIDGASAVVIADSSIAGASSAQSNVLSPDDPPYSR